MRNDCKYYVLGIALLFLCFAIFVQKIIADKNLIIDNQLETIEYLLIDFDDRKLLSEANKSLKELKDKE